MQVASPGYSSGLPQSQIPKQIVIAGLGEIAPGFKRLLLGIKIVQICSYPASNAFLGRLDKKAGRLYRFDKRGNARRTGQGQTILLP
jgi:hypothetical protein